MVTLHFDARIERRERDVNVDTTLGTWVPYNVVRRWGGTYDYPPYTVGNWVSLVERESVKNQGDFFIHIVFGPGTAPSDEEWGAAEGSVGVNLDYQREYHSTRLFLSDDAMADRIADGQVLVSALRALLPTIWEQFVACGEAEDRGEICVWTREKAQINVAIYAAWDKCFARKDVVPC